MEKDNHYIYLFKKKKIKKYKKIKKDIDTEEDWCYYNLRPLGTAGNILNVSQQAS